LNKEVVKFTESFFSSPSGTDSVLAPWITFSIPNGPFSDSHLATNSFAFRKLLKKRYEQKIDAVAAMMDAYIAYKLNRDAFE